MILNNDIQEIVDEVAKEMGITRLAATIAYRSFWMFIKETVENLPDMTTITEEEFDNQNVNFNIKHLGKFHTNFSKVERTNKYKRIINERTKDKKRKTSP